MKITTSHISPLRRSSFNFKYRYLLGVLILAIATFGVAYSPLVGFVHSEPIWTGNNIRLFVPSRTSILSQSWETNGPEGGGITAFVIDPQNPQKLYAGTPNGVFRSTDGGNTWVWCVSGTKLISITSLAISRSQPSVLYATSATNVYRSADSGNSWSVLSGLGPGFGSFWTIAVDPQNSSVAYVGKLNQGGIYRTTNGGDTWTSYSSPQLLKLVVDPFDSSTVYGVSQTGGVNGGLFRSVDGGVNWARVVNGTSFNNGVSDVALSEIHPGTFFVIAGAEWGGIYLSGHDVYKTSDSGITWTLQGSSPESLGRLVLSSTDDNIAYALTFNGIARSFNAGASWTNQPLANVVTVVAIDPMVPSKVYAGNNFFPGSGTGLYRSTDSGVTWTLSPLIRINVNDIAPDPGNSAITYAATSNGAYKRTGTNSAWQRISVGLPSDSRETHSIAVNPSDSSKLLIGTQSAGIFASSDGGQTWRSANTVNCSVHSIEYDPTNPNIVYAGISTTQRILKSIDGGATWFSSGSGITQGSSIVYTIAIDPSNPSILYAGGIQGATLYKSTDAGLNWTQSSVGIQTTNNEIYSIRINSVHPEVIYAGTDGSLYRSVNSGASWTAVGPSKIRSLVFDPLDEDTIYAAGVNGVYRSTNGTDWPLFNTGLPDRQYHAIQINSSGSSLYTGSYGSGVFDLMLRDTPTPTPTITPTPTPSPTATPCGGSDQSIAHDSTILVPRAGPNGPTGIGSGGDPLGDRTPVILIHGIHGNRENGHDTVADPAANLNFKYFENLIRYLNSGGAAYNDHFRTYSFHYVSDRYTAQDIGKALRDRIDEREEFSGKQIILVAHSMGGIVARHYLLQPSNSGTCQTSGTRVEKLITLATPHHGTYGANGWARQEKFPEDKRAFANSVFGASDDAYWRIRNACAACALQQNTGQPNRGTLLWDNFNNHFSSTILNQLPWEIHNDLADTSSYNNKIVAYWGEISPSDPSWRLTNIDPLSLPATIAHGEGVGDDLGLAAAAYLIDSAARGQFSLVNVPAPNNDGLVPVESSRFDGAMVNARVHCPGYNHFKMEVGSLTQCNDGKMLFRSIRDRIIGISVSSPPLFTGPLRVGFGNQSYGSGAVGIRSESSSVGDTISVELSNVGDEPLHVTSLSLAGQNPDQFAIASAPSTPFEVGPSSSVNVKLAFNPTSPGLKAAELRAENSSSNSVVTVHVSATGVPESCGVTLSPASQFIPSAGGNGEVVVGNIGCPWEEAALDDWIHTTPASDRVNFTVDPNTTGAIRFGTIVVSVYGRSHLYSISQDAEGAACWLSLSSDQSLMPTDAGSNGFYITSPDTCSWNIQSDSAWLVPGGPTLQGSGQLNFNVAKNLGSARTGTITIQSGDITAQYQVHQPKGTPFAFDFDGDSKADRTVYRPDEGNWYVDGSEVGYTGQVQWGVATDRVVAADYDGDGRTDHAVYRDGTWWVMGSNGGASSVEWGVASDVPVPADYDGDGKADLAVYRDGTWWILYANGTASATEWGISTDIPVPADYDGDGKADLAVYRDGTWWVMNSNGSGVSAIEWGISTDKPVPADYDGDGKTDLAVYRDGTWWIMYANGTASATEWGISTDKPVPADYDGDGKTDLAVYRDGDWWVINSNGGAYSTNWGLATDRPIPNRSEP